jgi:hypothetical protein
MKNQKYHTNPISNSKIAERNQIDTPDTQIRHCSLFWLGTWTSINSGGVKLVVLAQPSPLSEMMWVIYFS